MCVPQSAEIATTNPSNEKRVIRINTCVWLKTQKEHLCPLQQWIQWLIFFLRAATPLLPNTDLLLLLCWALEDVRHQARRRETGEYIFLYKTHIRSLLSIMTEGWKVEGSEPSDAAPSIAVKETPLLTEREKRTKVARVRWRLLYDRFILHYIHIYITCTSFWLWQRLQNRDSTVTWRLRRNNIETNSRRIASAFGRVSAFEDAPIRIH